jgi:hypothetical protein
MTDEEAQFVDAMGQFMGAYKLTPMAGRLWAWLLICEPPEQTAADLAADLQASRGAISGAAAFLTTAGMIRRARRRGDRREYFGVPPGTFNAILRTVGIAYGHLVEICEMGLAATAGWDPAARVRLEEVHDASVFIASEFPAHIERYLSERGRPAAGMGGATPRDTFGSDSVPARSGSLAS